MICGSIFDPERFQDLESSDFKGRLPSLVKIELYLDDQPFVLKTGARGLQNIQENFLEKYLYLRFEMGLEFFQQVLEYVQA